MSTLLTAQSLHVDTTFDTLPNDLPFILKKSDCIGPVGYNGCGKGTLLKLLDGTIPPTSGAVAQADRCHLARAEQHLPDDILPLTLQKAVLAQLPEHERAAQQWRVEALFAEMGFASENLSLTAQTLSGNQHTRLLSARVLMCNPDLPLLNELGNHLDLSTLLQLEQFLQNWSDSFVVISHDPRPLDVVTHGTWVSCDRALHAFDLPCSAARQALAERDVGDALRHKTEQKEVDRVTVSAKRLATWGWVYDNEDLSRKTKQMEKQIQHLKGVRAEVTSGSQWILTLRDGALHTGRLLEMTNLPVAPIPGVDTLFFIASIRLKSGGHVAIVGRSGCGESSLLRFTWQQFQTQIASTSLVLYPRVTLGYYDQTLHQFAGNNLLFDALEVFVPQLKIHRTALTSAGFPWVRHVQWAGALNGGECFRLLLAGLALVRYSLLMPDEPTNHLDIEGKEVLAKTLQRYNGGVPLVSHDRQLTSQSYNRFWLIDNDKLSGWYDLGTVNARIRETSAKMTVPRTVVVEKAEIGSDSDRLLGQLLDLEQCLVDDLTRKSKHQKPLLQTQWHKKIGHLNVQLG